VFTRVAIVGFGLIGGSIALAIKRRWPASLVVAVDRKPVIEAAMRVHAADVGGDSLVMAGDVDLVILAAPVRENIRLLPELPEHLQPTTLVTDVSSTKRQIVAAADAVPSLSFVGGHPMSGAATAGFSGARADLFDGRPWILTPRAHHPDSLQRLETFIAGLGGVTRIMTPALHDRLVGAVSHLPQLTASALMHVVGRLAGDAGLELAGAGLRDTTRLAGSPSEIWRDIAATNEDVLREALDDLIFTLSQLRDSLTDGGKIDEIFTSAIRWRQALVGTTGRESEEEDEAERGRDGEGADR
jgi:prephenate dehydrogenase